MTLQEWTVFLETLRARHGGKTEVHDIDQNGVFLVVDSRVHYEPLKRSPILVFAEETESA